MKKINIFLFMVIFLFTINCLIAEVIHVYTGESIQQAVNVAESYDTIMIHPYDEDPYYYEENVNLDSFTGTYLTITSEDPTNWNTVEDTHITYDNFLLPLFYADDDDIQDEITINILGIKMSLASQGIKLIDKVGFDFNLNIENCIFQDLGSYAIKTGNHTPLFVENCIFRECGQVVWSTRGWNGVSQTDYLLNISGCEFTNCWGHNIQSYWPANIDKCTFVQHNPGHPAIAALWTRGLLNNSIIWNYEISIIGNYRESLTVRYSDIEGGIPEHENIIDGGGNIDADPLFFDPDDMNFQLTELSPCIDAGDPLSPLDPDDTRADMGCYYFHHNYDRKLFLPGWQWVSFPYLENNGTYNGESYQQAYYENHLPGLLQDTYQGEPTINDFLRIDGKRDGNNIYIEPVNNNFSDYDFGFYNMLFRHEGYKIHVDEDGDQTYLFVGGNRLTSYTLDMTALENYWLGYYLPQYMNIEVAFGDFFEDVNRVWAEDWYYDALYIQRGGDPQLSANSTVGKTMEYGKMYIVQMYNDVDDFQWNTFGTPEEPTEKAETQLFTYVEKANYEAIDVLNIPPGVTEIGVFEGEICVGAVVVDSLSAQILAYTSSVNRDEIALTFQVSTSLRNIPQKINTYTVLNIESGEYEKRQLIAGRQEYSAVRLNIKDLETLVVPNLSLSQNYPNPFNPTTTISFSLPKEDDIELTIYNIKGQKVKTLFSGIAEEGKHTMIWEGKDTNDKSVSSGIYFYKLRTQNNEITRKMLLMK